MSDKSNIGWTEATWNPFSGCTKVSPGCLNCYAEALTLRWKRGKPFVRGQAEIKAHPDRYRLPYTWRQPRRVFVNSMSDLFHQDIPEKELAAVWQVMIDNPRHTFQILTKRPHVAAARISKLGLPMSGHIWLGVSAENQRLAESRIPELRRIPAPVRFVSFEPLLELIRVPLDGIHWVITGGESGPNRRPDDPDWYRTIRDQCVAAGVAYFHKQGSAFAPGKNRELDGRTWDEYPEPVEAQGVFA